MQCPQNFKIFKIFVDKTTKSCLLLGEEKDNNNDVVVTIYAYKHTILLSFL